MHRNATDAAQAYRQALAAFEAVHLPMIEAIERKYSANPGGALDPAIEMMLEAHMRNYAIDALLSALNWNLRPNGPEILSYLIPESPIASLRDQVRRHIDYLGVERNAGVPLLIVETKRPGSALPTLKAPERGSSSKREMLQSTAETLIAGLRGKMLTYDWNRWLSDVGDYSRSVAERTGTFPRRAVITDGCWCIIFRDPEKAFLRPTELTVDHIGVFQPNSGDSAVWRHLERHFSELFTELEYSKLAATAPDIDPAAVQFFLPADVETSAMRGLRLTFGPDVSPYTAKPRIHVSPLIFIRSKESQWLTVDSRADDLFVPLKEDELGAHLDLVGSRSDALAGEVVSAFRSQPQWVSMRDHYLDAESFRRLPGVRRINNRDEYLIVTGQSSHYFKEEPSVRDCAHHDWLATRRIDKQWPQEAAIQIPNVKDRTCFPSPRTHHCAHRDVEHVKSSPLTPENRARCGVRSGRDGEAFCEIRSFERHLCCRTCNFEEVCEKAAVFRLPCGRPIAAVQA
jgi:hypothetical protein